MTFLSPFPPNKPPQHVLRIAYVMPLHSSQTSFTPPPLTLFLGIDYIIFYQTCLPPPRIPLRHMKKVGGGEGGGRTLKCLR